MRSILAFTQPGSYSYYTCFIYWVSDLSNQVVNL